MITNPTKIIVTVQDHETIEFFEVQYYQGDNMVAMLKMPKPAPLTVGKYVLPLAEISALLPASARGPELSLWVASHAGAVRTNSTSAQETFRIIEGSVTPNLKPVSVVIS